MNILFSIIIPAYKRKFLYEAIESCLLQKYDNYEVIIVDDCSPENLPEIIDKFNSPKLHYYRNASNIGAVNLVDNWNYGLTLCNGQYVICMGDDDRLTPNCLESYYKIISSHEDVKVIHGWTEIIDENGYFREITLMRPKWESAYSLAWSRWNGRIRQYIGDWCFSTSHLRKIGGFYKLPLAWASDDITAVNAAIANGVWNTDEICFQYRENSLTVSNTGSAKIKMEAIIQEKMWFEHFLTIPCTSETDIKIRQNIEGSIEDYFFRKKRDLIENDLRNGGSFLYWLRKADAYKMRKRDVIRAFIPRLLRK